MLLLTNLDLEKDYIFFVSISAKVADDGLLLAFCAIPLKEYHCNKCGTLKTFAPYYYGDTVVNILDYF